VKLPVAAPPRGRFDAGRTYAGIALLCLAAAAATVLGVETMSAGAPRKPAAPSSPPAISDAQARSLAAMRYDNHLDGRVAFHADLGSPGTGVRVGGWIDWQRPPDRPTGWCRRYRDWSPSTPAVPPARPHQTGT
jgi:hypothetical protein